ncbi:MAG: DEAD/DEAH box helicase [Myxococcus sp.]|nr:DEAD/DEAH box helicase [Myxococcus sp.]
MSAPARAGFEYDGPVPTDAPPALDLFHPAVKAWFSSAFPAPTRAQSLGWPALVRDESTLLLAPTGSGKTLTAFLHGIDRLMFSPKPDGKRRCRVLYLSPLKALAVDVEKNLRAPIEGIARVAEARGDVFRRPELVIRTGDTPQKERARFSRESADLLITTPESLYLLLTSNAREALLGLETVIIDEIHAMVPTKRGAHLALSLERLEWMLGRPLQRVGLSATQRPLDEVARFLGGGRPVTVIDASTPKQLELTVEVPVEDMAKLGPPTMGKPTGPAPSTSIWSALHPRLLELVKGHRSTLLFVNNRRTSERLAAALNDLAGEVLVHAHHGSLAKDQRALIEARLKEGTLKGLVATSSLELGIDMGAIDLVVQIEAPPSVASGLQRVGRAGHQVGASSEGIVFPKYRGDLVACAALTSAMQEGAVERTQYPRNPLDVLAQHLVAMVSVDEWKVEPLFELVRRAAPFAELSRAMLEGVLELLSGRYPSDDFAELRPRLTWDRLTDTLTARDGARRVAVINGGTIPDRGLYGVFLVGAPKGQARVGELDEEMVYETKPGETFVLGASTWRVQEITFDKVMVTAAPGEPGKMPFWRGDQSARPLEFGKRIGALVRELSALPRSNAHHVLTSRHQLTEPAAKNLLNYLDDQRRHAAVPDDQTVVIERGRDELGDWRLCLLSPLGGQVLAPWSMAVQAHVRETLGLEVETLWANDGFVVRWPEGAAPPDGQHLLPRAAEVERLVLGQLSQTPLFAARFREIASRALLLPRKRPGQRTPLWQLRKKAQGLLAAASQYPSFPMILETYRECLRDVFDMPALLETLKDIERGAVTVKTVEPASPSPFAASLLFGYVANFLYEGDAPLAERRAQALTIDTLQLKELMGDAELRALLDAEALTELEAFLQHTGERPRARTMDGVHDLLLRLGDLTRAELNERCEPDVAKTVEALVAAHRVLPIELAQQPRLIPVEYASRYRDALGVTLPPGLPASLLTPAPDALAEVLLRYARTHGPFTLDDVARRFGLDEVALEAKLGALVLAGALLEGAFRPGGTAREWCDPEVLRSVRRKSLSRLRKEIEPVAPEVLTRMLLSWQGVSSKRTGPDALLDCVEKLQGLPLPASMLEREVLSARLAQYLPSDLDALAAAGEVVWVGVEPLGERDGKVALYLTDHLPSLYRAPTVDVAALPERERRLFEHLTAHGASFFPALQQAAGGGFPQETVDALWALVWKGQVTNDGFFALRAATRPLEPHASFRSRRAGTPPSVEGRWSLVASRFVAPAASPTQWAHATAHQLLSRYGVVTREVALAEEVPGGFTTLHDLFRALEESGRVRRGYFVTGVSAMQFALPPVLDLLRAARSQPARAPLEVLDLSALDPANPYGALLPWPAIVEPRADKRLVPMRMTGARVLLVNGALGAWLSRGGRSALVWLPDAEPERTRFADALAARLSALARRALERREGLLLEEVNGAPAHESAMAGALERAGFARTSSGFQMRRAR